MILARVIRATEACPERSRRVSFVVKNAFTTKDTKECTKVHKGMQI